MLFFLFKGQAPEISNYYVAAGMRSNGIASAGGVGTLIADWIVNGRPPFDLYGLDISRCLGMHNNKRLELFLNCPNTAKKILNLIKSYI